MIHSHLATFVPRELQIVPTVPPAERQAYERKLEQPNNALPEAVSLNDFRFDVLGTPSSPWNKSAARVFADLAIQQLCLPNTIDMFNSIKHGFTIYLDTIIRKYKHSLNSAEVKSMMRSKKNRHTRKYQLYHRRRFLAYTFPPLNPHIDMLESLGVDGMSSDESEADGNDHIQYKILTPAWRASIVAAWLRMFDTLYHILRRSGDVQALRGSFPHLRILTHQKSSKKTFVPGLPINVYDEGWISGDVRSHYFLRPLEKPYDFSHAPDIIE
ncbi:hypothetical protein C8J57DRAFT_1098216 [Mycena rebaudengoi]|nr:hypothetical protein C8J57DRAFT_1099177 [Mycena rebaudengoi]KAJ7210623.1 hypothetical protein C8J57DRAFT_1098216 [Mycena rebaudengoi]